MNIVDKNHQYLITYKVENKLKKLSHAGGVNRRLKYLSHVGRVVVFQSVNASKFMA